MCTLRKHRNRLGTAVLAPVPNPTARLLLACCLRNDQETTLAHEWACLSTLERRLLMLGFLLLPRLPDLPLSLFLSPLPVLTTRYALNGLAPDGNQGKINMFLLTDMLTFSKPLQFPPWECYVPAQPQQICISHRGQTKLLSKGCSLWSAFLEIPHTSMGILPLTTSERTATVGVGYIGLKELKPHLGQETNHVLKVIAKGWNSISQI